MGKKQEVKTTKKVEVFEMDNLPIVEMAKIDVKKYIGTKAKIVKADVIGTQFGRSIKFETEVIATEGSDKNPIEIKASKLLGLHQDENGKWGIGEGSKTHEFFKSWNLKSHKDMIGKIVVVQATEEKNGVQFLTFA